LKDSPNWIELKSKACQNYMRRKNCKEVAKFEDLSVIHEHFDHAQLDLSLTVDRSSATKKRATTPIPERERERAPRTPRERERGKEIEGSWDPAHSSCNLYRFIANSNERRGAG
jgi:hypothetical protein